MTWQGYKYRIRNTKIYIEPQNDLTVTNIKLEIRKIHITSENDLKVTNIESKKNFAVLGLYHNTLKG